MFSEATVVEILDEETLEPVSKVWQEGLVVLTNLTRKLMPLLRYPVGDRGMWTEKLGLNPNPLLTPGWNPNLRHPFPPGVSSLSRYIIANYEK